MPGWQPTWTSGGLPHGAQSWGPSEGIFGAGRAVILATKPHQLGVWAEQGNTDCFNSLALGLLPQFLLTCMWSRQLISGAKMRKGWSPEGRGQNKQDFHPLVRTRSRRF